MTRHRRKAPLLVGLAILGLLVGAWGGPVHGLARVHASLAHAGSRLTIALIPGLTIDPFYITMHYGALTEAHKLGVNLLWAGGTTWSPEVQTPVVNAMLARHPSALLIAPTDLVAMDPAIQRYVAAHIPVITVDTTITKTGLLASRISSDNYQGGEAAAATIARLAHYHGQVAVINTIAGISTTDLRQEGFLHQMKAYPHMKVVAAEYDQDKPTIAETDARSLILAHPQLVGIFGTNLYSADGAALGVDHAGKKGKIFVAGYDAEPAEVTLLRKGVINILVIQNPAQEGALAVQYAYDWLTGHRNLVKTSVLLPNVIATTANSHSPAIEKYFYRTSA